MPKNKTTAEIIDLTKLMDWHIRCGCNNDQFRILTTTPNEGLIIGIQCLQCKKKQLFDKRPIVDLLMQTEE